MRTYTISEAAELTGLSRKALARRVERGSLRYVVRDGRRRIPVSELIRVGLLEDDEGTDEDEFDPTLFLSGGARPRADLPARYDAGQTGQTLAAVLRELFDRFERQATELANLRALTVHAESLRVTSEMADLRARIADLETQRRPKELLTRHPAEPPSPASPPQPTPSSPPPQQGLWLPSGTRPTAPPSAARGVQGQAQLEGEIARLRTHLGHLEAHRPPRRIGRATRLVFEAVFLAVVAVGVWYAELGTGAIFALMAVAWIVVAVIEWVSWRRE
jgi:excisionase family DNA binding protein